MVDWQLELQVLPLAALRRFFDRPDPRWVSDDDAYSQHWWRGIDVGRGLRETLTVHLPIIPTSHSRVEIWGADLGDRFEIISREGIDEVFVRIDVRTAQPSSFVLLITDLAAENDWTFRTPNGHLSQTLYELLSGIYRTDMFQLFNPSSTGLISRLGLCCRILVLLLRTRPASLTQIRCASIALVSGFSEILATLVPERNCKSNRTHRSGRLLKPQQIDPSVAPSITGSTSNDKRTLSRPPCR